MKKLFFFVILILFSSSASAFFNNPFSILDASSLGNITLNIDLLNKEDIFCLQGGNCSLHFLNAEYTNINYTNSSEYCLNNSCISDWNKVNSNSSDYWDNLDTPADITYDEISGGDVNALGFYGYFTGILGYVGSLLMDGDPWYLSGTDLEIDRNLQVNNTYVEHDIMPTDTLTGNIGSGALRWLNLFVQNINAEEIDAFNLHLSENLTIDGLINGVNISNLSESFWTTNTAQTGITGDKTGSFSLRTSGTVQAEQLTSTDDITLTGILTDTSGTVSLSTNNLTFTGNCGIGAAASTTSKLYVSKNLIDASSASYNGVLSSIHTSGTGGATYATGMKFQVIPAHSTGTQYGVKGVWGSVDLWNVGGITFVDGGMYSIQGGRSTIGTVGEARGNMAWISFAADKTGQFTKAYGMASYLNANKGTIVTGHNFHGYAPAKHANGTFTTFAHIYLEDPVGVAGTTYAVQSMGGDWELTDGNLTTTGNLYNKADNSKHYFGAGNDASIYYDGTNLVINPKVVGTGYLGILGNLNVSGNITTPNSCGCGWEKGDFKMSNTITETTCWLVANGTGGTVDLRAKFIMGADAYFTLGSTGGSDSTSEGTANVVDRGHSHGLTNQADVCGDNTNAAVPQYGTDTGYADVVDSGHIHYNSLPPYYALIYKECVC